MKYETMNCKGKGNKPISDFFRKIYYRHLIKKYLKDCESIMDVGAGQGLFFKLARKMGKIVSGVDTSPYYAKDGIELKDFRDIDKRYDCFFSSQFLEHIDPYEYMEVVEKYCRKKIITIAPLPSFKFWNMPDHIRPYTNKAVRRLHESFGFKTIGKRNLNGSCVVIGERVEPLEEEPANFPSAYFKFEDKEDENRPTERNGTNS